MQVEVKVHIDNLLIPVFDRFVQLYFVNSSYVPEGIESALANPTKKNKTVRLMWYTMQRAEFEKRKINRITKNTLCHISENGQFVCQ